MRVIYVDWRLFQLRRRRWSVWYLLQSNPDSKKNYATEVWPKVFNDFLRMFRSRNLPLGRGKGNIAGETAMECVILENAAEPDSAAEKH